MLNRVILMGRLCGDPELKTTNTGVSVTSFRIAVDRSYVKAGAERETDFFDIVAWRSSAEFVCRNFSKGSLIAIDGQLQSRQYQTKDGQNRTVIEVVADNVSFTGERRDSQANREYTGGYDQRFAEASQQSGGPDDLRVNPRYPQSGQAPQQPQYQQWYQQSQYAPGAAYDPRDPQGTLAPNGDLPF